MPFRRKSEYVDLVRHLSADRSNIWKTFRVVVSPEKLNVVNFFRA